MKLKKNICCDSRANGKISVVTHGTGKEILVTTHMQLEKKISVATYMQLEKKSRLRPHT
jgi:divalent metal cation (Fe/Co/Zn/Cd) transporter